MKNIMLDRKVADLLEQIEAVNKMIDLHKSREDKAIALMSINQYVAHRQDFIDQLNTIFNKYALFVNPLDVSNVSKAKKLYKNEGLVTAAVAEDVVVYKKAE
jgi:flagellar biosynthesis chaperone FliJ